MVATQAPDVLRGALDAPVTQVTVMEDRAHVSRRGTIELTAGVHRLVVRNVAPVISDKTLMVKVAGAGASLIDARVGRERVLRHDDGDEVAQAKDGFDLERELEGLEERVAAAEAEHALLARQAAVTDSVVKLSLTELAIDAAWGRQVGDSWRERLDQARDAERTVQQALVASELAQEALREERERLQARMEVAANPVERAAAWIALELDVTSAGSHEIALDYIVPGACWRPYHTARLGDGAVTFETDACVWQNTGEDWRDVALRLSTERPSLGVEPPQLATDVVAARKKSDVIQVAAREQTIETTGLGGDEVERPPQVPGIDDGGDVQLLRPPTASDIPSDGKPYRVRIAAFSSDVTEELLCMAELTDSVVRKSTQTNGGEVPILAGPVDLIRDGGYVGRTSVLFIASGERFELGWGPEPTLRVTRETEVHKETSRMLSSWSTRIHDVHVHLSNIGVAPRTITVTERVPVSEIEKLQIATDRDHTRDGHAPDENGFVSWSVTVAPHGTDRVDLRFEVKKHDDVTGF